MFQGVDRAMVLASQAFTALIPLLILVSATVPTGSEDLVSDAFVRRFELAGQAATAVREVFAHSGDGSTGVLSVLLLVFSGVSLARRLQRMYLQAWGLDPLRGVRGSAYAALGLVALAGRDRRPVDAALPCSGHRQLDGCRACSRRCWPGACCGRRSRGCCWTAGSRGGGCCPAGALTGISTSVFGVATTIYMPELIESYSVQYGLFGVTLALVGWLLSVVDDRRDGHRHRRRAGPGRRVLGPAAACLARLRAGTDAPRLPPQG